MTLALLITAVSGAWAQTASYDIKEFVAPAAWETDEAVFTDADLPEDFMELTEDQAKAWTGAPKTGITVLVRGFNKDQNTVLCMFFNEGSTKGSTTPVKFTKKQIYYNSATTKYFYATASSGPEVAWDKTTKAGTFTMPAYDVEIAPIYAPAAQWAKVENVDQLPTAIEGIFAGTTDAIVKAGTVAMMGKTENPQGIVMYAVTSINQATAPELSAFSATVPTAENIADEGADVLVWYYIQGANTPDGQEATAENTFNDSEICTTPIKVTVLPNKYDIQFNAANDNTIEAGKATVKVGDAAATVTEGKLEGVKMGTKVTINAKNGYKFRKVAVKKGGAATLATALENGATVVIAFKYRDDGTCTFTNNNGTFTFVSGTGQLGGGNGPKQLSVENGKLIFKGSGTNSFTDRWSWYGFQVTFDPTANTYEVWKGSDLDVASFTSISVNGTDITDQLSELK